MQQQQPPEEEQHPVPTTGDETSDYRTPPGEEDAATGDDDESPTRGSIATGVEEGLVATGEGTPPGEEGRPCEWPMEMRRHTTAESDRYLGASIVTGDQPVRDLAWHAATALLNMPEVAGILGTLLEVRVVAESVLNANIPLAPAPRLLGGRPSCTSVFAAPPVFATTAAEVEWHRKRICCDLAAASGPAELAAMRWQWRQPDGSIGGSHRRRKHRQQPQASANTRKVLQNMKRMQAIKHTFSALKTIKGFKKQLHEYADTLTRSLHFTDGFGVRCMRYQWHRTEEKKAEKATARGDFLGVYSDLAL